MTVLRSADIAYSGGTISAQCRLSAIVANFSGTIFLRYEREEVCRFFRKSRAGFHLFFFQCLRCLQRNGSAHEGSTLTERYTELSRMELERQHSCYVWDTLEQDRGGWREVECEGDERVLSSHSSMKQPVNTLQTHTTEENPQTSHMMTRIGGFMLFV